jgi:hypothetical protein
MWPTWQGIFPQSVVVIPPAVHMRLAVEIPVLHRIPTTSHTHRWLAYSALFTHGFSRMPCPLLRQPRICCCCCLTVYWPSPHDIFSPAQTKRMRTMPLPDRAVFEASCLPHPLEAASSTTLALQWPPWQCHPCARATADQPVTFEPHQAA